MALFCVGYFMILLGLFLSIGLPLRAEWYRPMRDLRWWVTLGFMVIGFVAIIAATRVF